MEELKHGNLCLIHLDEKEHSQEIHQIIAKEILDINPEAIIFEFPRHSKSLFKELNVSKPRDKSKKLLQINRERNKQAQGNFNIIFDSIEKIWFEQNKQILLFEFDAPIDLTSEIINFEYGMTTEHLVWNFLREKYMVNFLLENKDSFINKKVLVLCHNFHWANIKFLLNLPSKEKVWKYYFFKLAKNYDFNCKSKDDLIEYLKNKKRKTLLKHWFIISDFE